MALVVKNPPANARDIRDTALIPGLGRSIGEGNGNPLQYSCLGNPIGKETWSYSPWGHKESDMTERLRVEIIRQNGGGRFVFQSLRPELRFL